MLRWCELGCPFASPGCERARRIDLHRQNQLQVRESCPEKGLDKGPIETRLGQDLGGPSIGRCCLLQHVCLERVGPLICDTVSQVAGTEVRAHFRSMRLLESRNSTRSASFPTASSDERSVTRSSKRDLALSPAFAGDHRAIGADRIGPTSAFEGEHGAPPA